LGPLAIPCYGVVAVLVFLACFAMLRPWSLREGLDPRRMRDFVASTALVALVGSRVVSLIVDWEQMLTDPLLLLYSAGHFLGGVVAAIVFGVVWLRYIKADWQPAALPRSAGRRAGRPSAEREARPRRAAAR
jgi:prolipoprotein diacylglyceryltransferase